MSILDRLPHKNLPTKEGELTVIFGNVRYVHAALDSNPNNVLYLAIPLPSVRKIVDKKGNARLSPEMCLYVLTDRRDLFECTIENFMDKGAMALIPKTEIIQRWDAQKIHEFLEGNAPEVNPYQVYQKIKQAFTYYVDFAANEKAEAFNSIYAIATYFFFLFNYFPYLKIGGIKAVGKTKLGTVFACITFNGKISASETASTIYRFAQDTRGTMVIDEQEGLQYKSEEYLAYRQILLSGFYTAGRAYRTNRETGKIEGYSSFCPKIIVAIGGLEEVLEDRAFEQILQRSTNREIMSRAVSEGSSEWQTIRDDLYLLLMQKWKEVKEIHENLTASDDSLKGRVWDLARPLLTVARLIDRYAPQGQNIVEKDVLEYLKREVKRKKEFQLESEAVVVLTAIYEMLRQEKLSPNYPFRLEVKKVTEKMAELEGWKEPPHPKRVTRILRNLHLYNEPRRAGRSGGYAFEVTMLSLQDAMQRYNLIPEGSEHAEQSEAKSEPKGITIAGTLVDNGAQSSSEPSERSEPSVKPDDKIYLFNCPCGQGPFVNSIAAREHQGQCDAYRNTRGNIPKHTGEKN